MDNELHRALASSALSLYRKESPNYRSGPGLDEPDEAAIIDLITDLLLLAKAFGENPIMIARSAMDHYEAEGA